MDIKDAKQNNLEQQYFDTLTEQDKKGIQVAQEVIPHIFCLNRTYGFQKWLQQKQPQKTTPS
jgi:hypothetical protein